VTTSLDDPRSDFETNALGTLNVLEACRRRAAPPPLLFTSTNKVYGGLDDVSLVRQGDRYLPENAKVRAHGISERRPLDFHSPYGCSKGSADQYVLDYARCFRLPAVVFRMSCIYGPHQCGNEDQGWVAHFVRQALQERPITFYGDGRQVRDLLFVEDLVDAMRAAIQNVKLVAGRAFNVGGGPANAASLWDVTRQIARLHEHQPEIEFGQWRPGDQRYYVSDIRTFRRATGWRPAVGVSEGLAALYRWLHRHETPRPSVAV
ncbi:MAG: NAD-dependent epimerase/dehydratase family protein, partial [Planctomycetaceae bacterium]